MKVIKALIVLVSLFSVAFAMDSIEDLEVTTVPSSPIKDQSLTSLDIKFKLSSTNGLSPERIVLLVNNESQKTNDNLSINFTSLNQNGGVADVTISVPGISLTKKTNTLIIRYLVRADIDTLVQASDSIEVEAQVADDTDDNNNDDSSNDSNGDLVVNNTNFNISLEDSLGTKLVSSSERSILITTRHSTNFLASITNGSDLGQLITNLRIRRLDGKKKINIKDQFDFELESASKDIGNNFVETVFKAKHSGIKEQQKIRFTTQINSFADEFDDSLFTDSDGNTVKLKDSATIKFNAIKQSLNGLILNTDLNFTIEKQRGKRLTLISNPFNLSTGTELSNNGKLASISEVKYFTRNEKNKKQKPKIQAGDKSIKVNISPSASVGVLTNGDAILPSQIRFKTRSKALEKKGFLNPAINKSVVIPLRIFAKDTNGLDVILEGQKEIETNINFTGI